MDIIAVVGDGARAKASIAAVGGLIVDPFTEQPCMQVLTTETPSPQVVTEQPCIMKLDVEGYEPTVLKVH